MTQEDIRSALSISTHKSIRYAIRRLLENGIIYRVANLLDMRSVSYRLATPNELSEAFAKLSDKVFQEVLEAMNISNSQLSEYKAFVKGT
jgi:predicted transcriptional regulator